MTIKMSRQYNILKKNVKFNPVSKSIFAIYLISISMLFGSTAVKASIWAKPCDHRYGAVATWSQCTDQTRNRGKFYWAEAWGFKYNLALTVFDSPFSFSDTADTLTLKERIECALTGRIKWQVYLQTDRWGDPKCQREKDIRRRFPLLPDYYSRKWTKKSIYAGFKVQVGTNKNRKDLQHGQTMFNLSNGRFGYDRKHRKMGKIDVATELIELHRNWIKKYFGYYPSAASYRNGQRGISYALPRYFLGVRNSTYIYKHNEYGQSKVNGKYLGTIPKHYKLSHWQAIWNLQNSTRIGDMNFSQEQAGLKYASDILENTIKSRGWYRDFIHWHGNPRFAVRIKDFFESQRKTMAKRDVITLGIGEALEHKFLRDMGTVRAVSQGNKVVIAVTYKAPSKTLPLDTITIPLSVKIDLTNTVLANKNITSNSALGIRTLGNNIFIIEVPFHGKEATVTVVLEETATPTPKYINLNRPVIISTILDDKILTITTDQPTRLAVFQKAKANQTPTMDILTRDNTLKKVHKISLKHVIDHLNEIDLYIGVITARKQSILSKVDGAILSLKN